MNIEACKSFLTKRLSEKYSSRETQNLTRIILEDAFGVGSKEGFQAPTMDEMEELLAQLDTGIPIQYIVGKSHFYDYILKVNPAVLIPRPETEELVYYILEYYQSINTKPQDIFEIGTGSACITLALADKFSSSNITSIDKSGEALIVAQENLDNYGISNVALFESDFLNASQVELVSKPYDLIVSNPPYIPFSETEHVGASTQKHEPDLALYTSDNKGIEFYEAIARFARKNLKKDGVVFCEINEFRKSETIDCFRKETFEDINCIKDMQGKDRVLLAKLRNTKS